MIKYESHSKHLSANRCYIKTPSFDCVEMFLVNDKAEIDGKILTKSQYKAVRSSDNYNGMKVSDFCIENKLELGVQPSPVSIIGDNFSMMEDIEFANIKIAEFKNSNDV